LSIQCLRTGQEPSVDNLPIENLVSRHEFDRAGAFREGTGDQLVIHHETSHEDALGEMRVEVGFLKPKRETLA